MKRVHDLTAEDILDRFALDDGGAIVYANDIFGGHGCLSRRKGERVALISQSGVRIQFRRNGVATSLDAGSVAFVLAFGKLPKKTRTVIRIATTTPNDYRSKNLCFTTVSDIAERGGMRATKDGEQWVAVIQKGKKKIRRRFAAKEQAQAFAWRLHRFMVRAAFREFWGHVGLDASVADLRLPSAPISSGNQIRLVHVGQGRRSDLR